MVALLVVALSLIGVWILLQLGEQLRRRHYHPEIVRKFVHITVATLAATWPFYMSWTYIVLLSLLLFLGVLASWRYGYFKAVRGARRHGWGELFFAMSIGFTALLASGQTGKWIFVAAMLSLGLADGLAAVVGTLFGEKHRYKVFGHTKSRAGTIAFWIAMILIVWFCAISRGPRDSWMTLVWLPPLVTFCENIGVEGLDNIIVPLLVVVSL